MLTPAWARAGGKGRLRLALALLVAALPLVGFTRAAFDAAPPSPAWVPDGSDGVDTLAASGGRVYVGGDFSHLGAPFGAFAVFRRGAEAPVASMVHFRDGDVGPLTDDGKGGWFVGGSFDEVGGVRCRNLVHVLANGRVDPHWCPRPPVTGALLRQGHVLYIVSGRAFRLDTRSGKSLPWRLRLGESASIHPGNVWALAAARRLVYLGGGFASVDGRPAKRLAAVDRLSGRLVWGAQVDGGPVDRLVVADGLLLVIGRFDRVDGRRRAGFAALDPQTGRLLDWRPRARIAHVFAVVASRRLLYLGYRPRTTPPPQPSPVTGMPRQESSLLAIKAETGATVWRRVHDSYPVALDGSDLLIWSHGALEAVDAASGAARRWRIMSDGFPATAAAGTQNLYYATGVAVSGSRVALGGGFYSIGPGAPRRGLAALDAATGAPTPWRADLGPAASDPAAVATVTAMTAAGQALYVAGDFTRVGGHRRSGLAAVDLETGATLPWKPPATAICDIGACALAATEKAVYVASSGAFEDLRVRGRPRRVAAFDPSTGAPLAWNPVPNDDVSAFVADNRAVYVAGSFTKVQGANDPYLAAVDAATGTPYPWRPAPDGPVRALALQGTTLYVAGDFTHVAGAPRLHLAALDTTSGQLLPWDPGARLRLDGVWQLVPAGPVVYITSRSGVRAVDALTGTNEPWPAAPSSATAVAATERLVYLTTRERLGLVAVPGPP